MNKQFYSNIHKKINYINSKTLILIWLLCIFNTPAHAANNLINTDSYIENNKDAKKSTNDVISEDEIKKLDSLLQQGALLVEEHKINEALQSYNDALEIANKYSLPLYKLQFLIGIANIQYLQNEPLTSIKYFQQALYIASTAKNLPYSVSYKTLWKHKNCQKTPNCDVPPPQVEEHLGYLYSRLAYLYYKNDPSLSKKYIKLAIEQNKKKPSNLAENYYNLAIIEKTLGFANESKTANKKYLKLKRYIKKNSNFFKISDLTQSNEYKYNITPLPEQKLITAEYADIQILNKVNGFTYLYEMKIGSKLKFKNIEVISRSCFKSSPENLSENLSLFEVREILKDSNQEIFNGWMFSSSSSLNSLEHPIYDIRLLNCRVKKI